MSKRLSAMILLVLTVACGGGKSPTAPSPSPSVPAPTTFSLSGQVTDSSTGAAVAGATLSIADGPNASRSTTSDASGNYSFTGLQQSGFTVNAVATGYTTVSKGVTLTSNQSVAFPMTRVSYQGTWSGTTSQGRPFNFVVNNSNGITSLTVGYMNQGSGCSTTGTTTVTFTTPRAISLGGTFTYDDPEMSIAGTFASTSAVSGTATFRPTATPGLPLCGGTVSATWTASKR